MQTVELPKEFLNKYISHIIKNINEENDEEWKGTMARQLAFFINNLIDNAHLNLKEEIPDNVKLFYLIFFID